MKSIKKFTATLLAASISLAMAIPAFATDFSNKESYTYEVQVQDAEGKVVSTVTPGSDIYLALYVYKTSAPEETITIAKNDASVIDFGYMISTDGLSSAYEGASDYEIDETGTIATDDGEGTLYVMGSVSGASAAIEFNSTAPVIRNKLTVTSNEIADVEVAYYEDNLSISGKVGACSPKNTITTKYSVEEKSVSEMPTAGTVIVDDLDGSKVVYTNSVEANTLNENTKFTVEFKKGDVVKSKSIKRTFGQIINGVIGEGAGVTGKVHFGVKIVDPSVDEADYGCFTVKPE